MVGHKTSSKLRMTVPIVWQKAEGFFKVLCTLLWNQNLKGCLQREGYSTVCLKQIDVMEAHCGGSIAMQTFRVHSESCVKLTKNFSDAEGSVLYTPTWRASPDWADRLSMSKEEVQLLIGFSYTIRNLENCHCKQ